MFSLEFEGRKNCDGEIVGQMMGVGNYKRLRAMVQIAENLVARFLHGQTRRFSDFLSSRACRGFVGAVFPRQEAPRFSFHENNE